MLLILSKAQYDKYHNGIYHHPLLQLSKMALFLPEFFQLFLEFTHQLERGLLLGLQGPESRL